MRSLTEQFSQKPADRSQSVESASDRLLREIARLERCLHDAKQALESEAARQEGSRAFLIDEDKVRRILAARRIRDRQLGHDLFAEPAWDLLLEAFAADLSQERTSVSTLCAASNVPASVAMRWLTKLEQDGWLKRSPGRAEPQLVELTPEGSLRLRRYFELVAPTLLI